MNFRALQNTHLVAAVLFVASVLVLAMQLITPSPIMVSMGDSSAQATQLGEYFTYSDVAVVVVAAVLCGASGTYLVLHDRAQQLVQPKHDRPDARSQPAVNGGVEPSNGVSDSDSGTWESHHERWEATAERLQNNEEVVYTALIEADGELPQRKLVEETDLSKATVSRTLDKLEHRELVERERVGIGNTVRLQ
ncbi:MarR family transcriptional regulator [Halogeometricum borinquense DSM 11551]|uniref:MarR family regulator n=2 Tax=Halogeometricum borinquense TaxID=60847 RepID=E4NV76_HALBP|nr:MarR family transcriptional regulator [Halogeometricum borinquense]ADQ69065.1 MarR family regulator [Halogeometricum borinquense DSM 11551]ELY29434.1 MarR family transcriptional regulator [Halogeometricum borinquense DSM 11551]RYJ08232.1 MarR family transcriptional regulator [Halogeometricum borinquense]